jgi:hypothetical protein
MALAVGLFLLFPAKYFHASGFLLTSSQLLLDLFHAKF